MGNFDDFNGGLQPLQQNSSMQDLQPLHGSQEFYQGNTYNQSGVSRIKEIEAQMVTIVDMQVQLAKAIDDLRYWSGWHQVGTSIVDAVMYIATFTKLSTGYKIIRTTNPATVVTKNGLRGTVIKNFRDFATAEAKKTTANGLVKEALTSTTQTYFISKINDILSSLRQDLSHSSDLELYFDSLLSSGKGSLDDLYRTNEQLNLEYNKLAAERWRLMHNE